ncbi:MAG TPA: ABC transporter substrate-binding protein [Candidatus Brocadiaceae bacterium]
MIIKKHLKFYTHLGYIALLSFLACVFFPSLQIFTPCVFAKGTTLSKYTDSVDNNVIVIRSQDIAAYNEAIEGFTGGCKSNNISIGAVYDLKGDEEEGKKVIQDIKINYHKPKLILAVGILAATIAKKQFTDIPIIYCMVVNHERFDLGGNNVTGISSEAPIEEQFAIFKKFFGRNKNIGVIFDPTSGSEKIVAEAEQIAQLYDFNLIKAEVTLTNEITPALGKIIDEIDALWIIPDYVVVTRDSLNTILKMTSKKRLPTFGSSSAMVKAGALFSISPDYAYTGLQASQIARILLNNPDSISLGVKKPERLKLAFNTQTAKIIGINLMPFQSRPDVMLFP